MSGSAGRTGRPSCAWGSSCARSAHRGRPLTGLPFDEETGTVPHHAGRVDGREGTYVVGWIKRGPGGGIGVNRRDAAETVASLIEDGKSGLIGTRPRRGLLRRRATRPV